MAFQFSLATVLRIRILREEREECMLQQIFQEIARTHQSVAHLDGEIAKVCNGRAAQLHKRVVGRDVGLAARETQALFECRKELDAQLEKLEQLKDAQLALYRSARQEREMLADLKSKHRNLHDAALARHEQKRLDDNFNARRLHR